MWNSVKISFRSLLKARGFSVAAVTVMALCIGANTAIFSVVNSVLWKPLSFSEPDRLVAVSEVLFPLNTNWGFSTPDYLFMAQQARSFSSIAAYTGMNWEFRGPIDRSGWMVIELPPHYSMCCAQGRRWGGFSMMRKTNIRGKSQSSATGTGDRHCTLAKM